MRRRMTSTSGPTATPGPAESQGDQAGTTFDPGLVARVDDVLLAYRRGQRDGHDDRRRLELHDAASARESSQCPEPCGFRVIDVALNSDTRLDCRQPTRRPTTCTSVRLSIPGPAESKGNQAATTFDPGRADGIDDVLLAYRRGQRHGHDNRCGVELHDAASACGAGQCAEPCGFRVIDVALTATLGWTVRRRRGVPRRVLRYDCRSPEPAELEGQPDVGTTFDPGRPGSSRRRTTGVSTRSTRRVRRPAWCGASRRCRRLPDSGRRHPVRQMHEHRRRAHSDTGLDCRQRCGFARRVPRHHSDARTWRSLQGNQVGTTFDPGLVGGFDDVLLAHRRGQCDRYGDRRGVELHDAASACGPGQCADPGEHRVAT